MKKKLFCALGLGVSLLLASSAASAAVTVQFKDNDGMTKTEWMRLELKIVNDESTPFDLANTKIKYYFSDTGQTWSTAFWSFLVNANPASLATVSASVDPEPTLKDGWVLTVKFSSGTIKANSDCWVLVGVHNSEWSVDETDDYSYQSSSVFQNDENIGLYKSAQRIFGPKIFEPVSGRSVFIPSGNPIISYNDRGHYSSDPVVGLVPVADDGSQMLYLATSTDICGTKSCNSSLPDGEVTDWAMDGIHVYRTSSPTPASVRWIEEGTLNSKTNNIDPVLSLLSYKTFGAQTSPKTMLAPDIQYVPGHPYGKLYMYIPMPTVNGGGWQIATAVADVKSDGSYDKFIPTGFLSLSVGERHKAPASPIDPGIFTEIDPASGLPNGNHFMLYVDSSFGHVDRMFGNLSMAALNSDMVSGTTLGKVQFKYPYTMDPILTDFMEGPDVTVMHTKSGKPYYYMIFSADSHSGKIGYAMANPERFPYGRLDWDFKGWIFQALGDSNNHANLIEIAGKQYIFYHQGFFDFGNHRRQVWAKEIALIDNPTNDPSLPGDGEIVGVTLPSPSSKSYGSLNGKTVSIDRGNVRYLRNAISSYDYGWSYVTLSADLTYNDGVGIYERALNTDSARQEWIVESIANTKIGNVTAPGNAFRIRNLLTPEKAMTCGAVYQKEPTTEGTTNYGLHNSKINTSSVNQVWLKETATDGPPGSYRLVSMWNNNSNEKYYLTRSTTPGDSNTFCKTAVSNKQKQMWFVE